MATKANIKQTQKLVKGMTIPTRPTVMMEVIKAQNAFAPDLQQVADVITRDVVLASEILREANIGLPGLKRKVASIEQAVMLLGLARIRKIVTGLFLSTALIGKGGPQQNLRHRCVDVGRIAAYMATELPKLSGSYQSGYLPLIEPDEAYVLGLFHDCGLSILMQKYSDYQSFYTEVQRTGSNDLVSAENERYRTNHCMVSFLLCEHWQLPPYLCEVIRDHHHSKQLTKPGKKIKDRRATALLGMLRISEYLNGELSQREWDHCKEDLYRFFEIDDAAMEQLFVGARKLNEQSAAAR